MKKNVLIFALGGELLDKDYGARYQDAKGLADQLNKSDEFNAFVTDEPFAYDPTTLHSVFVIPKQWDLFRGRPGMKKKYLNQLAFMNKLRKIEKDQRPEIYCFFNDIKIGLHGPYLDDRFLFETDPFKDLDFTAVYDFFCKCPDQTHLPKEVFIDEPYRKHVKAEVSIRWILISHLEHIIKTADASRKFVEYEQLDLFDQDRSLDSDMPEKINRLYYGDIRPDTIKSLKKLGFGDDENDYAIGSKQFKEIFGVKVLNNGEKMPIEKIGKYIRMADQNLLPLEPMKSVHQITARLLELVAYGGNNPIGHIKEDYLEGQSLLGNFYGIIKDDCISILILMMRHERKRLVNLVNLFHETSDLQKFDLSQFR